MKANILKKGRHMDAHKPLLVTGSHRSGTTWVGKMIAASPAMAYIHEPFNPLHHPGICTAVFPYWFMYVTNENEAAFYQPIKDTLAFRYHMLPELRAIRSARHVGRLARDCSNTMLYKMRRATPLVKDPIALFSSEWLVERFDMDAIVLIRHPAAFASSLKRLHWGHDFSQFLKQPLIMRDYLSPFEEEITAFAQKEHDILDQAMLLWRMMHHVILTFRQAHQDWMFLRHEDISADPVQHFKYIFKRLNLDFTENVEKTIRLYSSDSNPVEAAHGHTLIKRDSKSNTKAWKKSLTPDEILTIRRNVEPVSHAFYSDADW
jgi:hypothetical protein